MAPVRLQPHEHRGQRRSPRGADPQLDAREQLPGRGAGHHRAERVSGRPGRLLRRVQLRPGVAL
ncbi:MAG: hypothetical protein ACK56F_23890, partial [bacterium]